MDDTTQSRMSFLVRISPIVLLGLAILVGIVLFFALGRPTGPGQETMQGRTGEAADRSTQSSSDNR